MVRARRRRHDVVAMEMARQVAGTGDSALALRWVEQGAGCEGRLRALYERPGGKLVRVGWRCDSCGAAYFDAARTDDLEELA